MSSEKSSSKSAGVGVLVAITASLCCLTPVLALISGTSGLAASFSWMEPYRPFLIGLTVLVLGFAWYQKLLPASWHGKPKKAEIDCDCEDEKEPFMQSKLFLGMVTVFAAVMLAFPYYSDKFYPEIDKTDMTVNTSTISEVSLAVEGMTCSGCEAGINYNVNKLAGVSETKASYKDGQTVVKFDPTKTSREEIVKAINSSGFKVVEESQNSAGN